MVWPWQPTNSAFSRNWRCVESTASAYNSPRRKLSRARSATLACRAFIVFSTARRTFLGYGYWAWARNLKALPFLESETRTNATLMPSAEEAEIATGANVLDSGLFNRSGFQNAAHFQVVGGDQATVANFAAQDVGDQLF